MIFVDTGALIALADRKDQYHSEAVKIYTRLKLRKEHLLLTDYVIDETVTRLRYDLNHLVASKFLDFIERVEKTGVMTIETINKALFQKAKSIFRKYDDSVLSFTDCASFAVCKKHKISEAFAFDRHFTMMGISLLSSESRHS